MLTFAYYLLKVIICSAVLFGYYWFFLRNKNFHSYNRFYLLAIVVLSLVMPLMKINIWQKETEPPANVFKILQVVNSSDEYMDEVIVYSSRNHISKEQVVMLLFITVCCVFLAFLLHGLYRIWILLRSNPATSIENISFIKTKAKGTPFSFFRFIFWNDAIDIESRSGRQIFQHEIAHVQEKHSYDKLFINFVMIIFWCNPFFWLIRKELNMIHEFIADKKAIEDGNTADFAAMILQVSYPQHNFQLTNNFFYSPIKRRLLMLTQQNKTRAGYISRLLVLPLAFFVFAAFTLKTKTISAHTPKQEKQLVVVVDAGHGGSDLGASGLNNIKEKDITLAIAKKIKDLNAYSNIKIVLSRESDIYYTPQQRAAFAKEAGADLFVSVHMDGAAKATGIMRSGMTVFVARNQYPNSEASKVLASSVIASFNKNYGLAVDAAPKQREQGIWVLQANSCPSILIEAGCINNPQDFEYLKTDKAIETFAANILEAISNYSYQQEQTKETVALPLEKTVNSPQPESKEVNNDDAVKENQILADQVIVNEPGEAVLSGHLKTRLESFSAKTLFILNGNEVSISDVKEINWDKVRTVRLLSPKTAMKTYHEKGRYGVMIINAGTESLFGDGKKLTVVDGVIYDQPAEEAIMLALNEKDVESITLLNKAEAIKKYGSKAESGAVEIKTKPKELQLQQPDLTLSLSGIRGPRIVMEELKNITELRVEGADYKISNATVYFSGKGFSQVVMVYLQNAFLSSIGQYLKKIQPGSFMTFDNVTAIKKDGSKIELPGKAFSFFKREKGDLVFVNAEVMPRFPGGDNGWRDYLLKNLDPGIPVKEGWKPGTYKIMVRFIVDEAGNVSDIKAENLPESLTAQHCINLIKNGPKWIPAVQNGKKVKAYRKQPITFVISD